VCACVRARVCVCVCVCVRASLSLSLSLSLCVCVCRYLICFANRLKGDEEGVHAAALRGIQVSVQMFLI
jgi:hypothetical protein